MRSVLWVFLRSFGTGAKTTPPANAKSALCRGASPLFPAAVLAACCCLMSVHAAAANVFLDPMDDFSNRSYVKYTFLTKSEEQEFEGMADTTALSCSETVNNGWVEYTMTGAEKITLELYSKTGTFVTHNPQLGEQGEYTFEKLYGDVAGRMVARALYDPVKKGIYMRYDGALWQAKYDNFGGYYFFGKTDAVPRELINYGATAYAYLPGSGWTALALANEPAISMPEAPYYSELLTARIPPGATIIRVALSGSGEVPNLILINGNEIQSGVQPIRSGALASVKLEGAAMAYGAVAPVVTLPPPPEQEEPLEEPTEPARGSSSRAPSSSRASSSRSSASSKASSSPSSKFTGVIGPDVPGGGVKFSGVITDPAKEKQTGSPRETAAEKTEEAIPLERSFEQAATAPLTYEQPSAVIYQVEGSSPPGSRGNDASAWIVGYSVVLTGAILAVLLKSRRGK